MNREESIKLLALIKVAYPTAYRDMDTSSKQATVNMWHGTFGTVPYAIMEMAFDHFRRHNKFPPTVAEMYDELKGLYYRALGDISMAKQIGDTKAVARCRYVIDQTSQYRCSSDRGLNYAMISDNLLEHYADAPMLEGG